MAPSLVEKLSRAARSMASGSSAHSDLSSATRETIRAVRDYTMTSPERIAAACSAAQYVARNGIEGSIVECGVWRGGSMMAMLRTLVEEKHTAPDVYLYDTFEGMSTPTEIDRAFNGDSAKELLEKSDKREADSIWCKASLADVAKNVASVGYDPSKIHLIAGKVEDTIPAAAPETVALLRLDTDWYESTRHELIHLFPRLVRGGVLIVDDYGHWQGARKAVDEYFAENSVRILLNRIDYTGRIAVKVFD
jgi:hypothetical protein